MSTARIKDLDSAIAEFRAKGATIGPSLAEQLAGKVREQAKRKPSYVPGTMNRTEAAYADRLETLQRIGEVKSFAFEPETLILSTNTECTYMPDFRVRRDNGQIEYHEIKGRWVHDDSIVKLKWAAEKLPDARFYLAKARWDKDRKIYRWKIIRIGGSQHTHRKEWK